MILNKPLILCNFFNYNKKGPYIERGLALECNDPFNLINLVLESISNNPATKEKIDTFVKDFLYKPDGCASERVCSAILKLINNNKTTQY